MGREDEVTVNAEGGGAARPHRDRRSSLGVGLDYDDVPYFRDNDQADPALRPDLIMGLAALFGGAGAAGSLLDLGCGSGALLERVARATEADVRGIDISPVACAEARRRLAPLGARAAIQCADLLTLDPTSLGRVDMIMAVGFLYCVPPAVTRRAFAIMRECLRPGGVIVIGHYDGQCAGLNERLFATIRAGVSDDQPIPAAIAQARAILAQLDAETPLTEQSLSLKNMMAQAVAREDEQIYHEVLNPNWRALPTTLINAELDDADIQFACSLDRFAAQGQPTVAERLAALPAHDDDLGGHRYTLFVKPLSRDQANPWAPRLAWRSFLAKGDGPEEHYVETRPPGRRFDLYQRGARVFADATAHNPVTLDSIGGLRGLAAADRARLTADIYALMAAGATRPYAIAPPS